MTTEHAARNPRATRIAELNDTFRKTGQGGSVVATVGVVTLGDDFLKRAIAAVKGFSEFSAGNDPYGEHDFGTVHVDDRKLFWKIDYYDRLMEYGSEDPSDPQITSRVLTIMLAEEY